MTTEHKTTRINWKAQVMRAIVWLMPKPATGPEATLTVSPRECECGERRLYEGEAACMACFPTPTRDNADWNERCAKLAAKMNGAKP